MIKSLEKVGILRTDRIGEVLLSTVVMDEIKDSFPKARFVYVTSPYSKDILLNRDEIDDILIFDTMRKRSLKEVYRLARELKEKKLDIIFVLNPHKLLHLAAFISRVKIRAGYRRKWGKFLLTNSINDERNTAQKAEVDYSRDLLKSVGIKIAKTNPKIVLTDDEKNEGKKILSSCGVKFDNPVIAIHPMTSNLVKTWGESKYREIIRRLKTELEADIIVVGAESEREDINQVIRGILSEEKNLAGKTNLRELASILQDVDIFLGNDSGPMHIASTGRAYIVAIFNLDGGSSPLRWGPNTNNASILCQTSSNIEKSSNKIRYYNNLGVNIVFDEIKNRLNK